MTNDGENMAIRHERLPIYGLQFHPEALLTQYGLDILRNWINFVLKTTPAV
jgi:anthranilate/para-aminobenzoate synthase component II